MFVVKSGSLRANPTLTVDLKDEVVTCLETMKIYNIHHVIVVENGELLGVLDDLTMLRAILEHFSEEFLELEVFDLPLKKVPIVSLTTPIGDAINEMIEGGEDLLVLVGQNQSYQLFTSKDVLHLLDEILNSSESAPSLISGRFSYTPLWHSIVKTIGDIAK